MKRIGRRWGFKAKMVALFTSCTLSLIAAEAFVRFQFPVQMTEVDVGTVRLSDNPTLLYELQPLFRDHNRLGFRGEDATYAKDEGVFRILVLGDSLTYGMDLASHETIPRQLERFLSERDNRSSAIAEFEILNLGVPGYSIVQEAEQLRVMGLRFDPDLVILIVCLNDWDPYSVEFRELLARHNEPEARLLSFFYHPKNSWMRRLLYHSQLFRRSYLAAQTGMSPGPRVSGQRAHVVADARAFREYYSARPFYREHFERLSRRLVDRRIPLIVFLAPWVLDGEELYETGFDELQQLCSASSCVLVDLGNTGEGSLSASEFYLADGFHFSAAGARQVAHILADYVDRVLDRHR